MLLDKHHVSKKEMFNEDNKKFNKRFLKLAYYRKYINLVYSCVNEELLTNQEWTEKYNWNLQLIDRN